MAADIRIVFSLVAMACTPLPDEGLIDGPGFVEPPSGDTGSPDVPADPAPTDSGTADTGAQPEDTGDFGGTSDTGDEGTTDTGPDPLDAEICDNGVDDDWDGTADCGDPSCSTSDSCVCIDTDTGELLGTLWSGEISGSGDDAQGPCTATGGGEDVQFTWTPPEDGCYELTTAGSAFDTTLAIGDAWCGGEMRSCNDDAGGLHSTVSLSAQAGRSIRVLAEAYDEYNSGQLVVSVRSGSPFAEDDDADAGSAVGDAVLSGTLSTATAAITHDCADVTGASSIVRWEAPESGTWSFTSAGSDFDAAITVFGQCATAMTCDDFRAGDLQADAQVLLAEGDVVHLAIGGVDGETGSWVLNVAGPE
ncbi:MAG TPA: hypothetical protein DFR83_27590 [Deltaproteobacteria bacterium]|nr:hypothetical protein [Deltaproteobacteria bacterium]